MSYQPRGAVQSQMLVKSHQYDEYEEPCKFITSSARSNGNTNWQHNNEIVLSR